MKIFKFLTLMLSLIVVLWLLFGIELYKHDWVAIFLHTDNYPMLIIVFVGALVVGMIIKKLFVIEYKLLK